MILVAGLVYIIAASIAIHILDPQKQWMTGVLHPWRHRVAVGLAWSIIVVAVLVLI